MPFAKFPHIDSWRGRLPPEGTVFKSKIKIHGTNAAIRFDVDGITPQSRNRDLTISDDNAGFAAFVARHRGYLTSLFWTYVADKLGDVVVYGEWAGRGVQSGEAVHKLEPRFYVFAATVDGAWVFEPERLVSLLSDMPDDFTVLPWEDVTTSNPSNLEEARRLSEAVEQIGLEDPYFARQNTVGFGEGLVFYPILADGSPGNASWMFKAKSSRHTERKGEPAVRARPTDPVGEIGEFVERFVTDARLAKGLEALREVDPSIGRHRTGEYLAWISKDVLRECEDDLGELPWKAVANAITAKAKTYFSQNT